jgi:hypothetical protein
MFNGTLAVNYNGHGGPQAWCEERIFHISDINTFYNINKLPLFLTATCDFAPYDQILESAGEKLLTYDQGGAIGLMTTTALVFQYENVIINRDFWKNAYSRDQNNQSLSFGEIFRRTKNATYQNVLSEISLINFRKFALLADPATGFHLPSNRVVLETINGKPINAQADTLKSLNVYTITGSVRNAQLQPINDFNGTAYISIFDKVKKLKTLETNPTNPQLTYELQNDIVFNGKSNVVNGKFTTTFIVPKDINYSIGNAKVSLYAHTNDKDAIGSEVGLKIGGAGENNITDNLGPTIKPYLNDSNFVSGGLTNANSTLLINLSDENGINTTGTSVGHDITAILDGNTSEVISLNNFYQGANNDYKKGTVQYPLKNMAAGPHTLTIKAWDVLNNSNTAVLDFIVGSDKAEIDHVLNYPNPFFFETTFWFEHNHPNEMMTISVQIFTVSGKPVRSIQKVVNSPGSQNRDLKWDGKDEFGQKLGKGVYFYQISYKTLTGKSAQKIEKLVIL